KGVASRVERVAGNFLDRIPLADAYILKNIFHDWDDEFCSQILQTLKKTIQKGQKVLIIEQLVERNCSTGVGPASEAQMMVVCSGGKERSQAEIQELLNKNGFQLGRTFLHPIVSIIEGVAP
ncbi:MAG: methyltransferase, partial [Proteobacteria bacterium]